VRPLRIAAYTDSVEIGGAERALSHLVAALGDAFEVTVLAPSEDVASYIAGPKATSVVTPPRPALADAHAFRAHVRELRALRPDVLHANLISPFSCQYAISAAIALGIPSIAVYQLPNTPVNRRQRFLKRLTAHWTTAHVGVGERTAREVERTIGLRPGQVRTIHNGVPDTLVSPPLARDDGLATIGAVGRLVPQKGLDVLLRAMAEVPAARAMLVGQGDEEERLQALAHRLGVADRVSFLGWVDDPRRLLPSFDVFALPSRFEGFPLAVLEAQLAEVPVVAADVGSVAEAVIHERTGLLVPPDDPQALATALNTLLSDRQSGRRLGRAGRELVLDRYTATHMARAFERLYTELTS
jgi:glycosyltransferase involved in cell wall biosynthesis